MLKQSIRKAARRVGFDFLGVSAPTIEERFRRAYLNWLDRGYYGRMDYLARNVEKRLDPKKLVSGVKSIICVATSYYQRPQPISQDGGAVAMYAWGEDYHRIVKTKLIRLATEIESLIGRRLQVRRFVDTAPVLEKPLAEQAGLGWIGTNGSLIHSRLGSYLFLGELFVDLELEPDRPAKSYCSSCRRCVESCPTAAIVEPGLIDTRRCISYLTIEHDGPVECDLGKKFGNRIFGCDTCQQVCPFNRLAQHTMVQPFVEHKLGTELDPNDVLRWDQHEYELRTADSAGSRASLAQWQRSAKLILSSRAD